MSFWMSRSGVLYMYKLAPGSKPSDVFYLVSGKRVRPIQPYVLLQQLRFEKVRPSLYLRGMEVIDVDLLNTPNPSHKTPWRDTSPIIYSREQGTAGWKLISRNFVLTNKRKRSLDSILHHRPQL